MIMETWKPRRFVEEFQKRAGLLIDGKPGPQTQMALWLIPEPRGGRWYPPAEPAKPCRCNEPPKIAQNPDTTPTPIDPADIRPGDTFRLTHEATCEQIDKRTGDIVSTRGDVFAPVTVEGMAWHLVHRPDPDAEAVEALARTVYGVHQDDMDDYDRANMRQALAALRESGWDVVRRAES